MPIWKQYLIPRSIPEALSSLSKTQSSTRVIAGGTDLLLDLQQGRHPPVDVLVDLNHLPELQALEKRRDRLFIGAAVALNRIARDALVMEHAQALSEACALIGGPQVRNTATLGGNVAHALPAADGTITLMALGAQAEIAARDGSRIADLSELFLAPGKSTLATDEIIIGFLLPLRKNGQASAFQRVMRPQGVALPVLNMSVWLERSQDRIEDVRIAIGPASTTPYRARPAEEVLRGKPMDEIRLAEAHVAILQNAVFRTSPHRAGSEYRKHLSQVLLKVLFHEVWERAGA